MGRKVTIQDIADALGLSRNTVSKAINNSEGLAESTKQMILEKAVEMGYKQFSYVKAMSEAEKNRLHTSGPQSGEIALLTGTVAFSKSHFAALMLDKLYPELKQLGFSLVTHTVHADLIAGLSLPLTFRKENTKAIICIEVFDQSYADMICSLGIPVLFVDGPAFPGGRSVKADLLLMDNMTEISSFIQKKAAAGLTKFGFIGDPSHCQSFFERYAAYRFALTALNLSTDHKMIVSTHDNNLEDLRNYLVSMDEYPEVFICANDFVAIDSMMILRSFDPALLKKIRFLGFDDSHESRIFTPALSTVHIHTQAMAFQAVQLLVSRMNEPAMEFRTVHIATDLIQRESTEF